MTTDQQQNYFQIYRAGLLQDSVPFWLRHAPDPEFGGLCFSVNRDGSRLDSDKAVWLQGRFAWLLATLYSEIEPRQTWIDQADDAVRFLERHGFDEDGRMFFLVNREGRPLRKRRYFFSEIFLIMACAAMARATGDTSFTAKAVSLFEKVCSYSKNNLLTPKWDPCTRPMRGLASPMARLGAAQALRDCTGVPEASGWIDEAIEEICTNFVSKELGAVLETVSDAGRPILDTFDGRALNPGHAIEAAWFILRESDVRNDLSLRAIGIQMLDWMWERGWDPEFGGLFYFRDVLGLPPHEYYHDMKFWWPHNEAILANLLAWKLTGEPRFAERHAKVHEWTYARFPDPEYGEWFGYLHRDGTVSSPIKGNWWKGGAFHIGRMQLLASQWLTPRN